MLRNSILSCKKKRRRKRLSCQTSLWPMPLLQPTHLQLWLNQKIQLKAWFNQLQLRMPLLKLRCKMLQLRMPLLNLWFKMLQRILPQQLNIRKIQLKSKSARFSSQKNPFRIKRKRSTLFSMSKKKLKSRPLESNWRTRL